MTRLEIAAMFEIIDGAYRVDRKPDGAVMKAQLNVWHEFFKDDDANLVRQALNHVITHSHYKPNIADIKTRMRKMTNPTPAQLWQVLIASAEAGSKTVFYVPSNRIQTCFRAEFDKLPPVLQEYLGDWKALREFANTKHNSYERQQFLKEIHELQEKQEEQLLLEG